MLARMENLGWFHRVEGSRALFFTPKGHRAFPVAFPSD
jgi:hypothetical protein